MVLLGYLEIFVALLAFIIIPPVLRKVDGLPRCWPIVGMLPEFFLYFNRFHEMGTVVQEKNGCTVVIKGLRWSSSENMLFTVDPTNIRYMMSTNFVNFPKGSQFKRIFEVLGDGIFNSDSDWWKNQRRKAQLFLGHAKTLKFLERVIRDKVGSLQRILDEISEKGMVVDLQDLFDRLTLDVTSNLVAGFDTKALSIDFPEMEFSKALEDVEVAIFYRHIFPEWSWKIQELLGIGAEGKMKRAWEVLDSTAAKFIKMKREELGKDLVSNTGELEEEVGMDMLKSYMLDNMHSDNKDDCDDKFLRDTIVNFMVAGRDTTSSALTWFFWVLSNNPSEEAKIRKEIESLMFEGEEDDDTFQVLNKKTHRMIYLHSALCESLRLYPPVPLQHKCPIKPDVLPTGHQVNPDTRIISHMYAMGRMTAIWGKDCFEFKPERWISERGVVKHEPSYKFLTFNTGPRTCLGKGVAFTVMKIIAAVVIFKYDIRVLGGQQMIPTNSIILRMKHGLKAVIVRRRN